MVTKLNLNTCFSFGLESGCLQNGYITLLGRKEYWPLLLWLTEAEELMRNILLKTQDIIIICIYFLFFSNQRQQWQWVLHGVPSVKTSVAQYPLY